MRLLAPNGKIYPVYSVFYVTNLFVTDSIAKRPKKAKLIVQAKWKCLLPSGSENAKIGKVGLKRPNWQPCPLHYLLLGGQGASFQPLVLGGSRTVILGTVGRRSNHYATFP